MINPSAPSTYTSEQVTQLIEGFLELHPDEIESNKEKFHSVEKEGKILFPFFYLKTSMFDRTYIMFSKAKEKRKYVRKNKNQRPENLLK